MESRDGGPLNPLNPLVDFRESREGGPLNPLNPLVFSTRVRFVRPRERAQFFELVVLWPKAACFHLGSFIFRGKVSCWLKNIQKRAKILRQFRCRALPLIRVRAECVSGGVCAFSDNTVYLRFLAQNADSQLNTQYNHCISPKFHFVLFPVIVYF